MHAAALLLVAPALFAPTPQPQEAACANARTEDAISHYSRVLAELQARDTSAWPQELRERRATLLGELKRYRDSGDFTRWSEPAARVPVFVDDGGRHCAVANLLRFTGETTLVERVATADNHAWVWDLRDDGALGAWLANHGLTFDEAARIQFPAIPGPSTPSGPVPAMPGHYGGPGTGGGGSGPGSPSSPGGAPAATPRNLPGMPTSPGSPSGPETIGGEAFTDWGLWWEYNKLAWLRPRPLSGPTTAGDGMSAPESELAAARRIARPKIERELTSDDASVRAAAAVAFGRAAGAAAVEPLKAMLADPAREVRLAALAGLAATASEEGVHALLAIVHADEEPAPFLRAAGIVMLGAAAAEGLGRGVGAMLPSLIEDLDDDEAFAILAYAELAADAQLADFARERSGLFERKRARRVDAASTSRAIETLSLQAPEAVLSELLDAAGGRAIESRRAALNALGEVDGALAPLMTAYEGEHDPLARGYALLAIARHGGPPARDFLVDELEEAPSALRPWVALALGVLAGEEGDPLARAALRDAYGDEGVRTSRAAYLLAFGIGGDVQAEGLLKEGLLAKDAPTRSYAAQGLGLLRTVRGREALRQALIAETTPLVRSSIAQALALQGNAKDSEALISELDRAKGPLLRGQIAAALGLHGRRESIDGLLARLDGETLKGQSRAAALSALAVGLSGRDRLTLSGASAWSNFAVFPGWLGEILQQPL